MIRLLAAAILGLVILFGTGLLASRVDEPFFVVLGGAFLAFFGGPSVLLLLWRPRSDLEAARRTGNLQVHELSVTKAWQVEQQEDEGLHFFLELASGGTVFLSGQFLYEPFEARIFPSAGIRVSLDRPSGTVLALQCLGPRIAIERTLAAFSEEELNAGLYPGAFRLYSEPSGAVLAAFGRAV
jgi:hypothetical protein